MCPFHHTSHQQSSLHFEEMLKGCRVGMVESGLRERGKPEQACRHPFPERSHLITESTPSSLEAVFLWEGAKSGSQTCLLSLRCPPLSLPVRAQRSACPLRGRADTGRPGGPTLRTRLQPRAPWGLPYLGESALCLRQEAPDPVWAACACPASCELQVFSQIGSQLSLHLVVET